MDVFSLPINWALSQSKYVGFYPQIPGPFMWDLSASYRSTLVGLDTVDLGVEGIEKFHSIPKKRTDGRKEIVRPPLTAEDIETLGSSEFDWDVTDWQGNLLVTVKAWKLPKGYNVDVVDVRFIVPMTYPSAQLDMFYFSPSLHRKDGVAINAITNQDFNGEVWQRWSRHRTPESAWRPGVDDIGYMAACLREEIEGKK